MGEVVAATDGALGRRVALKRIRPELASWPEAVNRFVAEARVTAQLQHPGIVPVYALGALPDGRPWYTMQEVRGRTLADLLALPPGEEGGLLRMVDILRRVCDAVGYAHARRILHRDLKPANIMVGEWGEVLVMDWGLVKVIGRPEEHSADLPDLTPGTSPGTRAGRSIGTPGFMPPEQQEGRADQLTPAADVYALGATLFVFATGRPPSPREAKDEQLIRKGLRTSLHLGPFPEDLQAICLRALSPLPTDRYANATELGEALSTYLDGARRAHRQTALAMQADTRFGSLSPADQRITRAILVRLVGRSGECRAEPKAELRGISVGEAGDGSGANPDQPQHESNDRLLERLRELGLLMDRPTAGGDVELTLAEAEWTESWPRLGAWLGDTREERERADRLAALSRAWIQQGRPNTLLPHGRELREMEHLQESSPLGLLPTERALIAAARRGERARATSRFILGFSAVGALCVVVAILSLLLAEAREARRQESAARDRAIAAERATREALFQSTLRRAEEALAQGHPGLASVLAANALSVQEEPHARGVAMAAGSAWQAQLRETINIGSGKNCWYLDFEPNAGSVVARCDDRAVVVSPDHQHHSIENLLGSGRVVWADGGRLLLSAPRIGEASVLSWPEGRVIRSFTPSDQVTAHRGDPRGPFAWLGHANGRISRIDLRSGTSVAISEPGDPITSLTYLPARGSLAVARGKTLVELDADRLHSKGPRWTSPIEVAYLAGSPQGDRVALASYQPSGSVGRIGVINIGSGETRTLSTMGSSIEEVAWSPDGELLLAIDRSKGAEVWRATDLSHLASWDLPEGELNAVRFLGPSELLTLSRDGVLRRWDFPSATRFPAPLPDTFPAVPVALAGGDLSVLTIDGRHQERSAHTGNVVEGPPFPHGAVYTATAIAGGLVAGGEAGIVATYSDRPVLGSDEAPTDRDKDAMRTRRWHTGPTLGRGVNLLAADRDGQHILAVDPASWRIFRNSGEMEREILPEPGESAWAGVMDPDGSIFAVQSTEGRIQSQYLGNGEVIGTWKNPPAARSAAPIVLHGPSKRVIHELGGKLLLLSWPALRPELQFPLTPCTIDTQYLSVSPDGKRVALSGNDGTLAIANVETKLVEACFRAHSGGVLYTAFTEDGQHLVSTSADGHIGIWQLALLDTPPATLLENLANSHGLELREGRVSAKR